MHVQSRQILTGIPDGSHWADFFTFDPKRSERMNLGDRYFQFPFIVKISMFGPEAHLENALLLASRSA